MFKRFAHNKQVGQKARANKDRHIWNKYRRHVGSNSEQTERAGQPTRSNHGGCVHARDRSLCHGYTGQPVAVCGRVKEGQ
eukprot:4337570-Heterocapsa_arctica.AAC.1